MRLRIKFFLADVKYTFPSYVWAPWFKKPSKIKKIYIGPLMQFKICCLPKRILSMKNHCWINVVKRWPVKYFFEIFLKALYNFETNLITLWCNCFTFKIHYFINYRHLFVVHYKQKTTLQVFYIHLWILKMFIFSFLKYYVNTMKWKLEIVPYYHAFQTNTSFLPYCFGKSWNIEERM